MDFSNLFITGFILNNIYPICTTILVFIYDKFPIYTFDSISDPINSEDLLNKIKEDKSFIMGILSNKEIKYLRVFFIILKRDI